MKSKNPNPFAILVLTPFLCVAAVSAQAPAATAPGLSVAAEANFANQVQALNEEKANRTPAQRKMDAQLIFAQREQRIGKAVAAADYLQADVKLSADGRVLLDISGSITQELLDEIKRLGGEIVNAHPEYLAVRAWLPLANAETLAGRDDVKFIKPAVEAVTNAFTGQGVRTHRADYVFNNINIAGGSTKADGTGVKVGVISDSSDFLAQAQGTGDLPSGVTVLNGQSGSPATGEGTAMMEIVHEVAPGAQLFFATGFAGEAQMAANIRALKAQGCSIIIDDVTYADESPFQVSSSTELPGVIADAVAEVSGQGVLYFSSAANSGNKTDGTASTWEGDFTALGTLPPVVGPTNDWGGSNYNKVTAASKTDTANLFWSDPLGNAANDYDLYSVDSAGNILRASNNTTQPYERLSKINVGDNIVVVKSSGSARFLHLDVGRGRLQYSTPGSTRGHNASDAANAFCVAATSVVNSPSPAVFTGGNTNPVETFSSDGPRHLFYDSSGSAITPGDVSSTGGKIIDKPDITAADGVNNSGFYAANSGLNPFFGTSAAAPHAGAIAALLKSYNPAFTPAEIRKFLESTALATMADGRDRDSGIGIVMADRAIGAAQPSVISLTPASYTFDVAVGGNGAGQSFPLNIQNTGANPLNWTIQGNAGFLNPQSLSGTVAPGTTQTVNVGLYATAISSRPAGTYSGYVSVFDSQGGTNRSVFVTLRVNANSTAPEVTVTSPAHQSSIAGFSTVSGTASAADGVAGNVVNFTLYHVSSGSYWTGSGWSSSQVQLVAPFDTSSGVWTWNGALPNAANGTSRAGQYALSASTIDNDGRTSPPRSGVNNILFTVDSSPPTVALLSPADQSIISDASFSFNGTANDDQGIDRVILFIRRNSDNTYWNGSGWVSDSRQANLSSTYDSNAHTWASAATLPAPGAGMTNGSYNFQALAIDKAGNNTFATADVTVLFVVKWTGATLRDNDPNNDSTDWSTAANWSTNSVPGPNDIVQIANGDTVTSSVARTVRGLRLGAGTTANYKITVTGGPGTSLWFGGTISSPVQIAPGAAMTIDTTNQPYLTRGTITNAGTITIVASNPNNPQFINGNNASVINQSGGRIEIARDGLVLRNVGTPPVITNQGNSVFVKTAAAIGRSVIDWKLDNDGTVACDSGSLAFDAGSTSSGSSGIFASTVAAARIEFAGSEHLFNTGTRFTGLGRGLLSAGTVHLGGAVTVGMQGQAAGGFEITGGLIYGTGSLSVIGGSGTAIWSGGEIGSTLSLGAGTNASFDTSGTPYLNGGTITNAGTITITASNPNNPQFINGNSASLVNQSGGRIQIARAGLVLRNVGTPPIITNQPNSVFVKTTGSGNQSLIDWKMDNNGVVGADGGSLAFDAGSTPSGSSGIFNSSAASARIEFAGSEHLLNEGTRFTGPGRGTISAGILHFLGVTTVGTAGQAAGGFEILGGTMYGTGSLSVIGGSGTTIWSGGEVATTLSFGAGTIARFDTSGTPYLNGGTITNAGTITIVASNPNNPQFINGNSASVINQSGGRIEIARDGLVLRNVGTPPIITNQSGGVFVKTTNANGRSIIDWRVDNDGVVGSDSGTIAFDAGSTPNGSSGIFNSSAASARIEFAGNEHLLNGGVRFTGPGRGLLSLGTLHIVGTVTIGTQGQASGGFDMTGGNTYGPGTLSMIGGSALWSGGEIGTALTLGSGTTSTFDTSGTPYLNGGAITNAGTITISASNPNNPQFINGNNATLVNQSGGRIQIARAGLVLRNVGTPPIITNQPNSVFVKTTGSGNQSLIDWKMDNDGTVTTDTSSLAFDIGTNAGSSGIFNSSTAAARIEFVGGTHTLKAGTRFTGPGRGRVTSGDLVLSGAVSIGTQGAPVGGFELTGGGISGGSGSMTFAGGSGTFAWSGGEIGTTVNLGSGIVMAIDSSGTPYLNGGFIDNSGTITVSASNPNSVQFVNGNNSTINNEPTGRIEVARDGLIFRNVGTPPVVTSYGVIAKTGGVGTTDFGSFTLIERGTLSSPPSTILHLTDAVTFDFPSQIVGGKVLFDAAAPTLKAPITIGAGSVLELAGGGFNGASDSNSNALCTIDGPGVFSWKAGTISGVLNLGTQLGWIIDTTAVPTLINAMINHSGAAAVTGSGRIEGHSSTLNIKAGAVFEVQASTYFRNLATPPLIANAGMFRISGASMSVTSEWNFTQLSGGVLDLQVAGKSAAQFSRLLLNASATLGGTLNTNLINGFIPNSGDSFPLITYNSESGQFVNVHAPGFKYSVAYNANNFSLVALAQPTLAEWKQGYFGDPNSPQAADTAAPGGDSISNLMKYALGLNPMLSGAAGLPTLGSGGAGSIAPSSDRAIEAGTTHPTYSFQRIDPADVTFIVQSTTDVNRANGWTEIARLAAGTSSWIGSASVTETGAGSTRGVVVTDSTTLFTAPRKFYRLLVTH